MSGFIRHVIAAPSMRITSVTNPDMPRNGRLSLGFLSPMVQTGYIIEGTVATRGSSAALACLMGAIVAEWRKLIGLGAGIVVVLLGAVGIAAYTGLIGAGAPDTLEYVAKLRSGGLVIGFRVCPYVAVSEVSVEQGGKKVEFRAPTGVHGAKIALDGHPPPGFSVDGEIGKISPDSELHITWITPKGTRTTMDIKPASLPAGYFIDAGTAMKDRHSLTELRTTANCG